jgi:hypothetical protein
MAKVSAWDRQQGAFQALDIDHSLLDIGYSERTFHLADFPVDGRLCASFP